MGCASSSSLDGDTVNNTELAGIDGLRPPPPPVLRTRAEIMRRRRGQAPLPTEEVTLRNAEAARRRHAYRADRADEEALESLERSRSQSRSCSSRSQSQHSESFEPSTGPSAGSERVALPTNGRLAQLFAQADQQGPPGVAGRGELDTAVDDAQRIPQVQGGASDADAASSDRPLNVFDLVESEEEDASAAGTQSPVSGREESVHIHRFAAHPPIAGSGPGRRPIEEDGSPLDFSGGGSGSFTPRATSRGTGRAVVDGSMGSFARTSSDIPQLSQPASRNGPGLASLRSKLITPTSR